MLGWTSRTIDLSWLVDRKGGLRVDQASMWGDVEKGTDSIGVGRATS